VVLHQTPVPLLRLASKTSPKIVVFRNVCAGHEDNALVLAAQRGFQPHFRDGAANHITIVPFIGHENRPVGMKVLEVALADQPDVRVFKNRLRELLQDHTAASRHDDRENIIQPDDDVIAVNGDMIGGCEDFGKPSPKLPHVHAQSGGHHFQTTQAVVFTPRFMGQPDQEIPEGFRSDNLGKIAHCETRAVRLNLAVFRGDVSLIIRWH